MHLKHLQSWMVGVEVAQVEGVAVAKACAVEQGAVVVECTCAPHHLVASVAIHIGYRHVVVAVAIHRGAASAAGRMQSAIGLVGARAVGIVGGHSVAVSRPVRAEPPLMELLPVEVDRPDEGEGVISATEDAAGWFVASVELCHAGQEALATVAIAGIVGLAAAVVPVEGAGGSPAIASVAVGVVEDGVHGLTRQSVEHGEILLPARYLAVAIAIDGGVAGVLDDVFRSRLVHVVVLAVL